MIFKKSNEFKENGLVKKDAFRKSDFIKIKTLGQGSEGIVDLVEHTASGKIYALKVIISKGKIFPWKNI